MVNPKTGGLQLYMTEADIAAFHARYMTLATVERAFVEHRRTILAKLTRAGVEPFGRPDADYGHLYLCDEVEDVLRQS